MQISYFVNNTRLDSLASYEVFLINGPVLYEYIIGGQHQKSVSGGLTRRWQMSENRREQNKNDMIWSTPVPALMFPRGAQPVQRPRRPLYRALLLDL